MFPIQIVKRVFDICRASSDLHAAISGIVDEMKSMFTDQELSEAAHLAQALDDYKPWSEQVGDLSLSMMKKAVEAGDDVAARNAIKSGMKDTASSLCINLLCAAATKACSKCPEILSEALPQAVIKKVWFGG